MSPVSLSQDKLPVPSQAPSSPTSPAPTVKPNRPTYTPGKEKREIQTPDLQDNADSEPSELQEEPKGQANPFLPPDLEDLVEKQISEDVWEGLKGELPCVQATTECVNQLQNSALTSSKLLRELDERIAEANNRIDEAKARNLPSPFPASHPFCKASSIPP